MTKKIDLAKSRADRTDQLDYLINGAVTDSRHRIELIAGSLAHLSPLARLSGGYGFASAPDGTPIRSAAQLQPGDPFRLRLRDGLILATADEVRQG